MSKAIQVKVDSFEFEQQDLRQIDLVLPFGEFSFEVDFSDTSSKTKLLEILDLYTNKDKILSGDNLSEEDAFSAIDILNKIKNSVDYVYDVSICKEIYKHIDPMKKIVVNGKPTIFCMHLLNCVIRNIDAVIFAEKKNETKNQMREFVNKNA